jgi:hypothetical protein
VNIITKHPTIAGATEFVTEFEYSEAGHTRTGRYRETCISGNDIDPGYIAVQARSHVQQLWVDVSELGPEHAERVGELILDAATWLLANKPDRVVIDHVRPL